MKMSRIAAGASLAVAVLVTGCCGHRCKTRAQCAPVYESVPMMAPTTTEGVPQPTPMEQPPQYESGN